MFSALSFMFFTSRKCRPPGRLLLNKALLIFSFSFHFWSALTSWPSEHECSNFQFFIWNLRQRGTAQHTVNANELCTKALLGSCWFRIPVYVICGVRPWWVSVRNALTHSQTNTQYINTDVYFKDLCNMWKFSTSINTLAYWMLEK